MREIKFRAWDKEKKEMIEHNSQELILIPCIDNYGADRHYHTEGDDVDISKFDWASADLISQRYILMQFTGIKDKNGKEIYFDSDIVNYTYTVEDDDGEYEVTKTGTVVLDLEWTNSLCVKTKGGAKLHFTANEERNIEIIGNIHEPLEAK